MPQQSQNVLNYARHLADQLDQDITSVDSFQGRPYWQANDLSAEVRIAARAVATLDFFRQYAGADSTSSARM